MADATDDPAVAAAQRAAEQARLRKERREAKIRAGGSARLNKITGLAGGVPRDPEPTSTPASAPTAGPAAHADPDEVDISEHYYEPKPRTPVPAPGPEPSLSDDQLRQLMLGLDRPAGGLPGAGNGASLDDDPIMKMMSQMMGSAGFPPGALPGAGGGPNAASSPFANLPGFAPQAPVPKDPLTSLWRVLHALVALGLGLYIVLLTPFAGTKIERERAAVDVSFDEADAAQRRRLFFWTFATAETVLLTTRFFLDKSRAPPPGILGTVVGFLPEPIKGYVQIALRYGQIFTTVRADMLACIFVLGACSWVRG